MPFINLTRFRLDRYIQKGKTMLGCTATDCGAYGVCFKERDGETCHCIHPRYYGPSCEFYSALESFGFFENLEFHNSRFVFSLYCNAAPLGSRRTLQGPSIETPKTPIRGFWPQFMVLRVQLNIQNNQLTKLNIQLKSVKNSIEVNWKRWIDTHGDFMNWLIWQNVQLIIQKSQLDFCINSWFCFRYFFFFNWSSQSIESMPNEAHKMSIGGF